MPPDPASDDPDAPRTPPTVYLRSSWLERWLVILVLAAIGVGMYHVETLRREHRQTRQVVCAAMAALDRPLTICGPAG